MMIASKRLTGSRTRLAVGRAQTLTRGCLLAALLVTPAAAEYRVQQGDTIEIEIAGIPELKQRSTVQPDGAIAFPLVGAIGVEGLTPEQLRSAVQTQLAKKIYRARTNDGREILTVIQSDEVSAAIVAFRPVYVTGDVAKPGEQTFLPGMTVRQTLALAGGIDISARFVKASRDPLALRSDYGLAWADFVTAIAKIARITAEVSGHAELGALDFSNAPLPSERLAEIEKSESAILEARMANYERERDFLKSSLDQSDERISVVQKQQAEEEEGMAADTTELKRLADLVSKGQAINPRVTEARRALLLSSTRALQVNVELLDLKRQKSESARKIQQFEDDRRLALLKELEDATSARTVAQIKLEALDSALKIARAPLSVQLQGDAPRRIEVVRQGGNGQTRFLVDEDFALAPGDVIDVALGAPQQSSSVKP
jgi:polysaccharide biosynthesis/export protein